MKPQIVDVALQMFSSFSNFGSQGVSQTNVSCCIHSACRRRSTSDRMSGVLLGMGSGGRSMRVYGRACEDSFRTSIHLCWTA